MLTDPKILRKLARIEAAYVPLRFERHAELPLELCEVRGILGREPEGTWHPIDRGATWGGDGVTGWFRTEACVPEALNGREVYLEARLAAEPTFTIVNGETLLRVNGEAHAAFDRNHTFVRLLPKATPGATLHLSFETYAGHSYPGTMPHDAPLTVGAKLFEGAWLCTERCDVSDFVFDLRALLQLVEVLDEHSHRRAQVMKALVEVHRLIRALPAEHPESDWRPRLAEARQRMRPELASHNAPSAPEMGVFAHSHIDTAWLWPYSETWRKCARTFATMANLLEQYPEAVFMQSAPIHLDAVRQRHPALFERIRQLVRAGQWEPNGATWLEPDCNIPSGESLVRQFLKGIQWTRQHLDGYQGDVFWQPDVFGYCAALPQILLGCGVPYFSTTKMAWNDTSRFPFDSFRWRGIDGSEVVVHLSAIPTEIDPKTLDAQWKWAQHKDGESMRLLAYGHGDGGGGPVHESMEMIRRLKNLEGVPRTAHTTLSAFMKKLAGRRAELPVWVGELYLELHRGTTTTWSLYKYYNRKIELALRDAEYLATVSMLDNQQAWPAQALADIWDPLLLNQFHDIIPGTSIATANEEALPLYEDAFARVRSLNREQLARLAATPAPLPADAPAPTRERLMMANTLSWDRTGVLTLPGVADLAPTAANCTWQMTETVEGLPMLLVDGPTVPALGSAIIELAPVPPAQRATPGVGTPFRVGSNWVETPFARVEFSPEGAITSFYDRFARRELVRPGGAFNQFLMGEDVPEVWDAWDIDRDQRHFLAPVAYLEGRVVQHSGPLELRMRTLYRLGTGTSGILQDIVFRSDSPRVEFETIINWSERHQLLKVGFDHAIHADTAKFEIQFGHVERAIHENLPSDRARFEVCMHRWADVSENGFGLTLMNDCKYGLGARPGELRLSLIKSGTKPDPRADAGRHLVTYAIMPHYGPFSVETVARPAWELNSPLMLAPAGPDATAFTPLLEIDAPNILVDAIKRAESGTGFIVRFHEAQRLGGHVKLRFTRRVASVHKVNLIEEQPQALTLNDGNEVELYVRPFEIVTLHVQ